MFLKDDYGGSLEINLNGGFDVDGWSSVSIRIYVPGLAADYSACVRIAEFRWFYDELVQLKNNTSKNAKFTTVEGDLHLNCELQNTGRVVCRGRADNGAGSALEFYLSVENQAVCNLLLQLERLFKNHPEMGTP